MSLNADWIRSLASIAKDCEKGKYVPPAKINEALRVLNYYRNKYLEFEEEMTFSQAELIDGRIQTLAETMKKTHPDIATDKQGTYKTKADAEAFDKTYKSPLDNPNVIKGTLKINW